MLVITISTLFHRLEKIKPGQFPINENLRYVISCQGEKDHDHDYYESHLTTLFGLNVIWGEELKPGLANNRNNALKLACDNFAHLGSYIYICDDDIIPSLDGLLNAVEVMNAKNLACLTGIIATEDGLFKKYNNLPYRHTKLSAAKICSVEILVNLDFIIDNKIFFDNQFGLGSKYPSGEEFILINDIIAMGGRVDFYPIQVCIHPPLSSGDDFYSSDHKIMAKGAMLKRVFVFPLYYILIIAFAIKKYKVYRHRISLLQFLYKMLKGTMGLNK
ncbi:hypothetical protein M2263_003196 [Providencia alcalifaciens]|nr:hypothetical protein [Providencia alcalifaciens]